MLQIFKSQLQRYLTDDGHEDINFEPRRTRLTSAQHRLLVATDEFQKALGELRDELLLTGRSLN